MGCRVMAKGPFWSLKDQGRGATVVEASDLAGVTVRWDEKKSASGGKASKKAGTVVTYKLSSKKGKHIFAFSCTERPNSEILGY